MNNIIVNIDNSFILLAILIVVTVITIRIAVKSSGYWKALISVSGLLIGVISGVIIDLIRTNISTYSMILVVSVYTLMSLLAITGLFMFIAGIVFLLDAFKTRNK